MTSGYWYIASPYSKYHAGIDAAHDAIAFEVALLMKEGIAAYCPILHCHNLAKLHSLPTDAGFWQAFNHTMIEHSCGIIVVMLAGWRESSGVEDEITLAFNLSKPIVPMVPGVVPSLVGRR